MLTRSIRRATLASLMFASLLTSPTRASAQCTYPTIPSPGIWVYLKETMDGGERLSISLVNLTDFVLLNSSTVTAENDGYTFEPPFDGVPVLVKDINGNGLTDAGDVGVPPYSTVSWVSYPAPARNPQHYHGNLTLELVGYRNENGTVFPAPSWPNKFHVVFTSQWAYGGSDYPEKGTWVALRPDDFSAWDARNRFRSGVWTTPHYPADLYNPAPDDLDMRNIMTISNRWVVVTLYRPSSNDGWATRNLVIVVRQTNWYGDPAYDPRSDSNPTANMDDYSAQKLDWKFNPGFDVPRYNTGYYDSPYGAIWGCNCYQEACH